MSGRWLHDFGCLPRQRGASVCSCRAGCGVLPRILFFVLGVERLLSAAIVCVRPLRVLVYEVYVATKKAYSYTKYVATKKLDFLSRTWPQP